MKKCEDCGYKNTKFCSKNCSFYHLRLNECIDKIYEIIKEMKGEKK